MWSYSEGERSLSGKLKILCIGDPSLRNSEVIDFLGNIYDVVEVDDTVAALSQIVQGSFAGILLFSNAVEEQLRVGFFATE